MSALRTLQILKEIRAAGHDHVAVSYSGGKDSIAVLDLCSQVFPKVSAWFQYIVEGLEVEEVNIRFAERRYGIEMLRLPSPALVNMMRAGYFMPKPIAFRRAWKFSDVMRTVRDVTGAHVLAFGHRMDESLQRRGMLSENEPHPEYSERLGKLYPLARWNAKGVYAYMRSRKIPIPQNLGRFDTSGVSLGTDVLINLRDNHPDDFAKILEVFPLAGAKIMKAEMRRKRGLDVDQGRVRGTLKTKAPVNK